MPIYREIRQWILSLIKVRKFLVRSGKSHANLIEMLTNIDILERYLDAYPYNTDVKIAGFFIRNRHRIHSLIPGNKSKSHEKWQRSFYEFLGKSRRIITNKSQLKLFANGNT